MIPRCCASVYVCVCAVRKEEGGLVGESASGKVGSDKTIPDLAMMLKTTHIVYHCLFGVTKDTRGRIRIYVPPDQIFVTPTIEGSCRKSLAPAFSV